MIPTPRIELRKSQSCKILRRLLNVPLWQCQISLWDALKQSKCEDPQLNFLRSILLRSIQRSLLEKKLQINVQTLRSWGQWSDGSKKALDVVTLSIGDIGHLHIIDIQYVPLLMSESQSDFTWQMRIVGAQYEVEALMFFPQCSFVHDVWIMIMVPLVCD